MILLSYVAYFLTSTAAPIFRRFIIKKKNPEGLEQIRFAFEIMLVLVLGSLLFQFFTPLYFAGSPMRLILLTLTCGIFGMGYFIANYTSQKYIDAGITIVVINIYTPLTILFSSLFFHEGLTSMQIIGTILLLIAMFIISKKHRTTTFRFDKYFLRMLLAGIFLSVVLIAERALQKQTGLSGSILLSWGSQCFFLGLASLYLKSKHSYTPKEVLSTGVINFMSSASYVTLVFVVGNLALVSSVTTFVIVTIFIAAAIFLKEREDLPRKILGSVIAVIGLLLM